jgi:hypothetical protein
MEANAVHSRANVALMAGKIKSFAVSLKEVAPLRYELTFTITVHKPYHALALTQLAVWTFNLVTTFETSVTRFFQICTHFVH